MMPRHIPSPFFTPLYHPSALVSLRARVLRWARVAGLGLLWGSTALYGADTPAPGPACDDFKTALVGRMDPSIRGYSMQTVAASAPVPAGGKVIGTCEGGAWKIVYFRFGAPVPAPAPAPMASVKPIVPATVNTAVPATSSALPAEPSPTPRPELSTSNARTSEVPTDAVLAAAGRFFATQWQWLLALLGLVLAGMAWAWWAHYKAFDASGLPRGPRL